MDNAKMVNAVSMESLDNCSTISSLEAMSQVRTLFVSGLPMDCKPRELYLLFRAYAGYENSLLKVTNKNGKVSAPVGFVTFATRQDADEACRKLQGVRFDPDNPQSIRLELARSNTKVSKPKQPSPPIISPATLPVLLPHQHQQAAAAAAAAFLPPPTGSQQAADLQGLIDHIPYLNDPQLFGIALNPYATQLQLFPGNSANNPSLIPTSQAALAATLAQFQQHQQHQQQQLTGLLAAAAATMHQPPPPPLQNGNPPCSTLFVANLGSNVGEEEVRSLFKQFSGFCRLRMHHKGTSSVAFVEYQTIPHASIVLQTLQGYQLSNNSLVRIEYAKAKMGETNNNGTSNVTANPGAIKADA